LVAAI
jgi:hypothetical protein